MPHLVIAYSQDLEQDYSIETPMNKTFKAAIDSKFHPVQKVSEALEFR